MKALMAMFVLLNSRSGSNVLKAEDVDFIYVEGQQSLVDVDVPFALPESCAMAFFEPLFALEIESISLDGRLIPATLTLSKVDVSENVTIKAPRPGFQYRLSLFSLGSIVEIIDAHTLRMRTFGVSRNAPLPEKVEVRYRVRCADGKITSEAITRGRKIRLGTGNQKPLNTRKPVLGGDNEGRAK